jgi:hypothetical protein
MSTKASVWYNPALRMKAGELEGLGALAPDIAARTLPRMIVPPPSERDGAVQSVLLESEAQPDIGRALGAVWHGRDVLVEPTHILDEFDRARSGFWLPKAFEAAWVRGVRAIPLVQAGDLLGDASDAFRAAASHDADIKLGIVVSSGDLADHDTIGRVIDRLECLGLEPRQCLITADFHDADFGQPALVAPIIAGVLDLLTAAGLWQQIVFQGTNYPEKNPATAGGHYIVPRNEWIAWRQAVKFDPQTAEHMIFGDYAADCAKLAFGKSRARAIPHYRYATPDAWFVQRGQEKGTHTENMRKVCIEIVSSGLFAGRDFSAADDHIYLCGNGRAGPGNAKNWRAINTTHHITRVVSDIGAIRGVRFSKREVIPLAEQVSLFA